MKKRVKILIMRKSSQTLPILRLLKNNKLFNSCKIDYYATRKLNNRKSPKTKQKVLSKYDIILSDMWLGPLKFNDNARGKNFNIDTLFEYKKTNKNQLIIELTHGPFFKPIPDWMPYINPGIIDYIVAANGQTSKILHTISGLKETNILDIGYPRLEYYNNLDLKWVKNQILNTYPDIVLDKMVLFAPTWMYEGKNVDVNIDFIIENISFDKIFYIALHPNTIKLKNINFYSEKGYNDKFIILDKPWEVPGEKLMLFADKLITDYSSIYFDFQAYSSIKNCYFFRPDINGTQDKNTIDSYKMMNEGWNTIPFNPKEISKDKQFFNQMDNKIKPSHFISELILGKIKEMIPRE